MVFRQSILAMDECEIFELVEACYTFACLNHSGQWSDLYSLMCEIGQEFKPGMAWSETQVEQENQFYNDIDEENIHHIWARCQYVLENRWE